MFESKKVMYSSSMVDTDACAENIGNRFQLVLVAATRTRELSRGALKKVKDHNSAPVTALKEIEAGHITKDYLKRITTNDNKRLRPKGRKDF